MHRTYHFIAGLLLGTLSCSSIWCQEASVNPGINDSFKNPSVKEFVERFEVESREVYQRRDAILKACEIKEGQTVADIGAGTGLFTRLFSKAVGDKGHVIAVDISQNFLNHINELSREQKQTNIATLLCTADSTNLPENSTDLAFICDTYHHFEFPFKTMDSLFQALKPGGRLILIDFHRIEGISSDWTLSHVRAGQNVFEEEIQKSGFVKKSEAKDLLKDNYFVVFEKPTKQQISENETAFQRGNQRGRGRGFGRGFNTDMHADQDVFHYLLEHHSDIRRQVTKTKSGVETLTESDNPEVAAKIQEHVSSMHKRIKEGRGLRFWDELFAAIFADYKKIEMTYEDTDKGVKVIETSKDPRMVTLIQAHADVVSLFVKHGFDEAHKNHPVPKSDKPQTDNLVFPIIQGQGGVVPRPTAVEQPRAGAKFLFDVTADSKPEEISKGLDRAARLLNLYGAAGLKASDVKIAIILHGDATKIALSHESYKTRFTVESNPNLTLIEKLRNSGVDVMVCGQALNTKGFTDPEVDPSVSIAVSAMTAISNKQQDGYSYVPIP